MRIFREKKSLRDHDGYPKTAHAAISGMPGTNGGDERRAAAASAALSAGLARLPQP
jgi:hypothetical protein